MRLFFLFIFVLFISCQSSIDFEPKSTTPAEEKKNEENTTENTTEVLEIKIENFDVDDFIITNIGTEVRSLALSPDKELIYTCALNSPRELYAYNKGSGVLQHSTTYGASPRFCKSMDVHSSGRVFFSLSDSDEIGLANQDLSTLTYLQIESLIPDITDNGNNDVDPQQLYIYENFLYVASDKLGRIYRFNLNPSNGDILTLDSSWGTSGFVQVLDGIGANITSSGELLSMVYDERASSLFAVLEGLDAVVKISNEGKVQNFDVLDIPIDSSPHDIVIFNEYLLVSYGALDGSQNMPNGIGVFKRDDLSLVDTLIDENSQLRNAQGLVTDQDEKAFYVIDGFYGAPNDISLPRVNDSANQNLIMKFIYNK